MRKRDIVFAVLGIAFAAACIRLGIWQLTRLADRKKLNSELRARAETPAVDLDALPRDTGAAHFRRVTLTGTYDFDREIILMNRSRNGSPGVNIVTPLKTRSDTSVLVNRGWIYAPDGMTADLAAWREMAQMTREGYIEYFRKTQGSAKSTSHPRAYRWLDSATLSQAFPYPVRPYLVVLIEDSGKAAANVPPRVALPPLDEGPHQSYAIQWFSFAAISIFGTILYLRRK